MSQKIPNKASQGEKDKKQTPKKSLMSQVRNRWDYLFDNYNKDEVMKAIGYAYTDSPYVQNQRVKRLAGLPVKPERDKLEKALINPMDNEQTIRHNSYSLFSNYSILKLNNLYADMLTYRNYFYSRGVKESELKAKRYEKERKRILNWIEKLQPERTFNKIALSVQREGKKAYYLRDSQNEKKGFDYVYLQELPSDYVKIVGWNTASGFTVSFDFTYFWQAGTSTEQFPPIFEDFFQELNMVIPKNNPNKLINPKSLPAGGDVQIYKTGNSWHYWKTLPADECFVFSQDESLAWWVPNTAGLFLQAQDLQDYNYLQQQLLQLPLSSVIMGTMPMNKDKEGTSSTDNYSLSTGAFSFFTEIFNSVAPSGTKLFITPATDYKFFNFDQNTVNNTDIVSNALQQFNSMAGVGGLMVTNDKPNVSQTKTQQLVESAYISKMYHQFENCVNLWWENKLDLRYTWKFVIKGSIFTDLETFPRTEKAITIGQNYMIPEYLSYFGLYIDDIQGLQNEVNSTGIYDKMKNLQSAFNSTSEDLGRPSKDIKDIDSDGTAAAIDLGNNTSDGRITYKYSPRFCINCGEILTDNQINFCSIECKEEFSSDEKK